MWNRLVDSYSSDELKRRELIHIERDIFESVKPAVEVETGAWCGSREQNRMADSNIAEKITASFKSYETKGRRYQGSFFVFKY